jgi:hypothetical protein
MPDAKLSALRPLHQEERALLTSLLSRVMPGKSVAVPIDAQVEDMLDGGMGGIRFAQPSPRRFGKELLTGEYLDDDGELVSIALNVDDHGELFELDFWKVDFSPLKRYPSPRDVVLTG